MRSGGSTETPRTHSTHTLSTGSRYAAWNRVRRIASVSVSLAIRLMATSTSSSATAVLDVSRGCGRCPGDEAASEIDVAIGTMIVGGLDALGGCPLPVLMASAIGRPIGPAGTAPLAATADAARARDGPARHSLCHSRTGYRQRIDDQPALDHRTAADCKRGGRSVGRPGNRRRRCAAQGNRL